MHRPSTTRADALAFGTRITRPRHAGPSLLIAAIAALVTASAATAQITERYHPFQQGVDYRIEATQDDDSQILTGRARLRYTNNAPEAIDRLYFHQYLNAFRPNSAWARYDVEVENRREFQELGPDEHAFERIRSFAVNGHVVQPIYPFSPDSTVFYVELPDPLVPGERLEAEIDWTARAATEPRRQGREGRHVDWAHWYPRIAVYGSDGWEYRTHIRPGELNGTFGTYDVTLDLAADQVHAATGVPVRGNPGWVNAAIAPDERPLYRREFYDAPPEESLGLLSEHSASSRNRVRWYAEDVHNFAWSTSPDYRYRAGQWNDKAIHLVWEPTSEGWDPERIMETQIEALDWVQELFGEYPWPQITVTDRVEGGATEFPMLYMTSGGAVVHETMHMIAHGVLANNEWKEGWLDEGMASFLTSWLAEARGTPSEEVWGRNRDGVAQLDAAGESEPVGLPAAEFSSYRMYSTMTYGKGSLVLRMLRDMLGEDTFRQGLRGYYRQFRFRQVTGEDFKHAMEEASGRDLDWFFDQWLETTDALDYAVGEVRASGGAEGYTIEVEVIREGAAYMPVVVAAGDERAIADSRDVRQTVTFRLADRPDAVVIDPDGSLLDIDRSNNRKAVQ